jgi:hypothetical protein
MSLGKVRVERPSDGTIKPGVLQFFNFLTHQAGCQRDNFALAIERISADLGDRCCKTIVALTA